jgi:hypothetical protein
MPAVVSSLLCCCNDPEIGCDTFPSAVSVTWTGSASLEYNICTCPGEDNFGCPYSGSASTPSVSCIGTLVSRGSDGLCWYTGDGKNFSYFVLTGDVSCDWCNGGIGAEPKWFCAIGAFIGAPFRLGGFWYVQVILTYLSNNDFALYGATHPDYVPGDFNILGLPDQYPPQPFGTGCANAHLFGAQALYKGPIDTNSPIGVYLPDFGTDSEGFSFATREPISPFLTNVFVYSDNAGSVVVS